VTVRFMVEDGDNGFVSPFFTTVVKEQVNRLVIFVTALDLLNDSTGVLNAVRAVWVEE
jgi:hypothetical protein